MKIGSDPSGPISRLEEFGLGHLWITSVVSRTLYDDEGNEVLACGSIVKFPSCSAIQLKKRGFIWCRPLGKYKTAYMEIPKKDAMSTIAGNIFYD